MTRKGNFIVLAALFLLSCTVYMLAPAQAAGTLILSSSSALAGDTVTASGAFAPDTWIAVKAVDAGGNILFFDEVRSGSSGAYTLSFQVPPVSAGTLNVIAGYGGNVATAGLAVNQSGPSAYTVSVAAGPSAGGSVSGGGTYSEGASVTVTATANSGYRFVNWTRGGVQVSDSAGYTFNMPASNIDLTANFTTVDGGASPGGGGGTSTAQPVNSTTGSATVIPSTGGKVDLGSDVSVQIPAGALGGTSGVVVTLERDETPPEAPSGFMVRGYVYKVTANGQDHYTFNSPVTLTFTFDPSALAPGEKPAVFYYDEDTGQWVNIGGTVSGNTITVTVNHFTRYAVMTVKKSAPEQKPAAALKDISGHWAEANIRKLVEIGAISGYPDGTFRPDSNITRAEFAAVLVQAFHLEAEGGRVFSDTAGHWAKDFIATAASCGIVSGYDADRFGPDDPVTREQMAVMTVKAAGLAGTARQLTFTDTGDISGWALEAVAVSTYSGIMKGYPDNTVRPGGSATRSEAVTVILNTLNNK